MYKSVVTGHAAEIASSLEEETESGEETDDGRPLAAPGSSSSNTGDDACQAPATGSMHAHTKDWVIVKAPGCPTRFVEHSVWKNSKRSSIVAGLPTREKALYMYTRAFGGDALFGEKEVDCAQALSAIHCEFDGNLWGLREEDVAPCVKSIPPEILEPCSRDQFVEEYYRFRNWLQALRQTVFAREFYVFESCVVHKQGQDGRPLAAETCSFWASRQDIVEATDDNFLPRVGNIVHSKTHGKCKVEGVRQRVSSTKLLRYIMSTPYSEISCLKIHRVVHAYLRCTLLALQSESLAESVGSVLADSAQKATGRPKEVDVFIRATVVRLAGLRGHGGEEGILADALNTHFEAAGRGGPKHGGSRKSHRPLAVHGALSTRRLRCNKGFACSIVSHGCPRR